MKSIIIDNRLVCYDNTIKILPGHDVTWTVPYQESILPGKILTRTIPYQDRFLPGQ